jgi:hypothetical protein
VICAYALGARPPLLQDDYSARSRRCHPRWTDRRAAVDQHRSAASSCSTARINCRFDFACSASRSADTESRHRQLGFSPIDDAVCDSFGRCCRDLPRRCLHRQLDGQGAIHRAHLDKARGRRYDTATAFWPDSDDFGADIAPARRSHRGDHHHSIEAGRGWATATSFGPRHASADLCHDRRARYYVRPGRRALGWSNSLGAFDLCRRCSTPVLRHGRADNPRHARAAFYYCSRGAVSKET